MYPKFPLKRLPHMLGLSVIGTLIAGAYGIVHDQITYSISHEYFTKLKFEQFDYANFGLPERVFVAEVGFMATWWVGFFSAWLIARLLFPAWPLKDVYRKSFKGFGIIFGSAMIGGITGFILGATHSSDYSYWEPTVTYLQVTEPANFVSVALIHNAGYIGGLAGLIVCLMLMAIEKRDASRDWL
ncbi:MULTISPECIES: hypothetical protein [unclassified Lentimonas]|uniref:hypothetical protein n=1 Tax=unclassified Lentimonas TaxID=2630993 RepID=UPI001A7E4F69|nr:MULTISPECIES: hypothetical protein [unclassified Lentimonas]